MRVLIVSAAFPPELIVAGRLSAQLAAELAGRGHAVTVLAPFPSHPAGTLYPEFRRRLFDARQEAQGYRLVRCFSFFSGESSLASRFVENISFGLTSAWAALTLPRPDVIYAVTWPLFASLLIYLAARLRRVPLVVSVQDVYPESMIAQGRIGADSRVARGLEWLDAVVARGSQAVVVISENFAELYRGRRRTSAERVHVVPNWSETTPPEFAGRADDFRQGLSVPKSELLAVYGGNIGVAAGVETVVEAARLLAPGDEVAILIAGQGSRLEACRQLAGEIPGGRVLFRSPWPAEETAATFAAADVLLLPMRGAQSLASVPAKLIAYLFAARPVVALALPGSDVAQWVESGGCGWVVEPDRPEALAALLRDLATTDRAELSRRGEAARAYALQHLTRQACLPRMVSLIENAAEAGQPAHREPLKPWQRFAKRLMDLALSATALLILAPLLGVLALAVRATSAGPALFRQPRLGKDAVPFVMYKFRTMQLNAPDIRNADGSTFNAANDPRVTPLGNFLRKTSLDELPQLFNVFKGEMSLVGPRPDVVDALSIYRDRDHARLWVKPGLTGWAAIHGRNAIPLERRRDLDIEYVQQFSLRRDVEILFRTVTYVLRAENVFGPQAAEAQASRPGQYGMIEPLAQGQVSALLPLLAAYPFPTFGWYSAQFGEQAIRTMFVEGVQHRLASPRTQALWSHSGESANGLIAWTPLELESEHFGFPTATIDYLLATGDYREQRGIKEALLRELAGRGEPARPKHVAVRVDARDFSGVHALEACGFSLVDGLITFSRNLQRSPWQAATSDGHIVRPAAAADLPELVGLASSAYTFTRLHTDPAVPRAAADRLHGVWVEQSLQAEGNQVLVAADAAGITGYSVFKMNDETLPHLGQALGLWVIAASAERARGSGVAKALCLTMLDWYRERGVTFVEGGTQLANVASANLFESCGFRVVNTRLTFSKWLGESL